VARRSRSAVRAARSWCDSVVGSGELVFESMDRNLSSPPSNASTDTNMWRTISTEKDAGIYHERRRASGPEDQGHRARRLHGARTTPPQLPAPDPNDPEPSCQIPKRGHVVGWPRSPSFVNFAPSTDSRAPQPDAPGDRRDRRSRRWRAGFIVPRLWCRAQANSSPSNAGSMVMGAGR
jgi:hypothetical protein